jgi:hypothetical protein
MHLHWEWEVPPLEYEEHTRSVVDGEGAVCSAEARVWFLMDMGGSIFDPSNRPSLVSYNFGLIVCYDPSTCDTIGTIRLPEYGSVHPQATYHGLAYDDNDGTFWYTRAYLGAGYPPPGGGLYHVDGAGDPLGYLELDLSITGLAFDSVHNHLWGIVKGDPDMFVEYDVSTGVPELIQGPFPVEWWSPVITYGAAGLEYDEVENRLVAVNVQAGAKEHFCDIDPAYPSPSCRSRHVICAAGERGNSANFGLLDCVGQPSPIGESGSNNYGIHGGFVYPLGRFSEGREPGVAWESACYLSETEPPAWGVARFGGTDRVFIAASPPEGPFPLDIYGYPTGVPGPDLPESRTALSQNLPNPFNPSTSIAFTTPMPGRVTLRVYHVSGKLVRTLVDGWAEPKRHEMVWDGRDDLGRSVGSGVYFYALVTPGHRETKSMVLLK